MSSVEDFALDVIRAFFLGSILVGTFIFFELGTVEISASQVFGLLMIWISHKLSQDLSD